MTKAIALFLLLASCQFCFGQTDTNAIATGDWSKPVIASRGYTLRGRLLIYEGEGQYPSGVWAHRRVYLELQQVTKSGLRQPIEVYFDLHHSLHFEMRDSSDKPTRLAGLGTAGPFPRPYWIVLPYDSTVRLRADAYTLGPN
jgi:hypothetical protein